MSFAAGQPYQDKLFRLPPFLLEPDLPETKPDARDALDALELTGFFLARHVFQPHGRDLPAARTRFVDRLRDGAQTK